MYLPRYESGVANLMGYQLRKISEGKGPKYITASTKEDKGFTTLYTNNTSDNPHHYKGVIVEDLVSGLHLQRALDDLYYKIVVNYGVKINLYLLDALKNCNTTTVWLDNDSQHVINQAKQMYRYLGFDK